MKDKIKRVCIISLPVLFAVVLMATLAMVLSMNRRLNDSIPALNAGDVSDFYEDTTVPVGGDLDTLPTVSESEDTTAQPIEDTALTTPAETTPTRPVGSSGLGYVSYGNGTCYVSGIGSCTDAFVVIPEYSEAGDRVIAVGEGAFKGCRSIKGVEFPLTLCTIGANAFYDSGLRSVGIHSLISSIGDHAFGVCRDMISITVDGANAVYSDREGILFSKDKRVLICYPAGRGESTVTIPREVSEIRTMAFYGATALRMVHYEGTASEWKSMDIGPANEPITGAIVSYRTSGGK